ncbi:MAG TPA: fibrobacter succinogenes major paralogous domain-containing protein [Lentimicrobium sp.]|jgi:uncharacterized protein (TIGR02145 family)|nr:fibrobacter succinogenes major paralogous domain-containing protein [Lentimicrobium sp.]
MKNLDIKFHITALVLILILCNSCGKDDIVGIYDADGNLYHEVKIGTQTWLSENLKTTRFRNGDQIPYIIDDEQWVNQKSAAYCQYENSAENGNLYGLLYNSFAFTDPRNICPKGYRIPTDHDWEILEIYLQNNGFNSDNFVDNDNDRLTHNSIAQALCDSSIWANNNDIFTPGYHNFLYLNKSGFKALPGGFRTINGAFQYATTECFFWSSTHESYWYTIRLIHFYMKDMWKWKAYPYYGLSIRCIKE